MKEEREQAKLQKQAEREEAKEVKRVERQLRNELKAGQKGKQKVIQPKPTSISDAVVELSPVEEDARPIQPTRHGRIPKPRKPFDL